MSLASLGFTAAFQRTLQSGSKYEKYFDLTKLVRTDPIVKNGDTFVTIDLMSKLARKYQGDTAKLAPLLQGRDLEATCRNIWDFSYHHFQYTEDKAGVEQLRRPLRAWADRRAGIDCDCFSILCSTLLLNLGIAHRFRKTKYNGGKDFQHIYVVVPKPGGGHFTIDPVTDAFDKEEPFSEKFDKAMNIQVLNGPGMPIQVLNGLDNTPGLATVPAGSFAKFGFGAEFIGLKGEADQVRDQALQTIRTVSLSGLAAAAGSDVVPTAAQITELATATGQSRDEAAADHVAMERTAASFVERLRQQLVNTAGEIDRMPAGERPDELVRLRARLSLLLANWSNEPERTRLFTVLGDQEEVEYRAAGLRGLGLGGFFSAIGDAFSSVGSAIGNAASWVGHGVASAAGGVAQAANWTYGTVIKPVGQAIGQAASWVADKVKSAVVALATGIKNAVVWLADQAVKLGKLILKYNPLSILIRVGLRIAFRVNLFYMSGRLGAGYFSENQARAAGLDVDEYKKAKSQLGKVISMWEGLQGDLDVLQESILIGYQSGKQPKIASTPDGMKGLAGLRGLGAVEPVTATGTVAASGFITTIVTWLKSVNWEKLFKGAQAAAGVVTAVVAKFKSVPAMDENTQLRLPASEQDYRANEKTYESQKDDSSSLLTYAPLALGALALGYVYFSSKPSKS